VSQDVKGVFLRLRIKMYWRSCHTSFSENEKCAFLQNIE